MLGALVTFWKKRTRRRYIFATWVEHSDGLVARHPQRKIGKKDQNFSRTNLRAKSALFFSSD